MRTRIPRTIVLSLICWGCNGNNRDLTRSKAAELIKLQLGIPKKLTLKIDISRNANDKIIVTPTELQDLYKPLENLGYLTIIKKPVTDNSVIGTLFPADANQCVAVLTEEGRRAIGDGEIEKRFIHNRDKVGYQVRVINIIIGEYESVEVQGIKFTENNSKAMVVYNLPVTKVTDMGKKLPKAWFHIQTSAMSFQLWDDGWHRDFE